MDMPQNPFRDLLGGAQICERLYLHELKYAIK